MPSIQIIAQFVQQPITDNSFGYTIVKNGIPITYSATPTNSINKTYKSEIVEYINRMVSLDSTNNYNYVEDFIVGFDSQVFSISKQTSGKYIVSGSFTKYNNQPAMGICRLNTDFTLDTSFSSIPYTTPPVGFKVLHKLLSDNSIILYSLFQDDSAPFAPLRLAKLTPNGNVDTTFKAVSFNNNVRDIAIDNSDNIYAVGNFTNFVYLVGSTPTTVASNYIAKITSLGAYDISFVVGSGFSLPQFIIAYTPLVNRVTVGGGGTYKGLTFNGLIEINSVGTRTGKYYSLTGPSGGGNLVTAMHFDASGELTISGNFNSYNGLAVPNVIRIFTDSERDTTLPNGTTLNTPATFITRDATYTYLGGNFTVYSGQSILKFVKITSGGTATLTNSYDFNERVNAILVDNVNQVLLGGNFSIFANTVVPNNQTIIPTGVDVANTQSITLQNLIDFNSTSGITYTQSLNNIIITYTFLAGDTVSVINSFDSPNYVELIIDGAYIPPVINITNYPQNLTPVYNPITFNFTSLYNTKYGFRYLFNVYNTKNDSLIGGYKLSPQIDGTGYIDISSLLGNLTTVDFTPTSLLKEDAVNSYVDYNVTIGTEFGEQWFFNNIYSYSGGAQYSGYTTLSQTLPIGHSYQVGDQIIITSSLPSNSLNGLHQIREIVDNFNVVIDLKFIVGTPLSTNGYTVFADNRKIIFSGTSITGLTAFNGVRPWDDFINWNGSNYSLATTAYTANFLTDIPKQGFNITPTQDIFLNLHCDINEINTYILVVAETNNNITSFIAEIQPEDIVNSIQQVAVGFNQLLDIFPDCYPNPGEDCIDYYDVYVLIEGDPARRISDKYRFTLDKRCKIENYEILFMDRMGSLSSYSFQLRAFNKGNITRNMFKQQVDYTLSNNNYLNSYDITERGSYITNVNVVKTLDLNTNWMTDEMSVYFEQLLTSPYTWVKIDGKYYACTINDSDFEVVRQKNKNLIRKSITITMANNNAVNI